MVKNNNKDNRNKNQPGFKANPLKEGEKPALGSSPFEGEENEDDWEDEDPENPATKIPVAPAVDAPKTSIGAPAAPLSQPTPGSSPTSAPQTKLTPPNIVSTKIPVAPTDGAKKSVTKIPGKDRKHS